MQWAHESKVMILHYWKVWGFSMSNKQFVSLSVLVPGNEGSTVCWVNAHWSDKAQNDLPFLEQVLQMVELLKLADFGFGSF